MTQQHPHGVSGAPALDDATAQRLLNEAYAEWSQRSGGDDWPLTFARKVLAHVSGVNSPDGAQR